MTSDPVFEANDNLTGLLPMNRFFSYCGELLQKAQREGTLTEYSFAYFDIRDFKQYNATYGIRSGDKVLVRLAELMERYSTTKILSRLSSDHFCVISRSNDMYERIKTVITKFNAEFHHRGISVKAGIYRMREKAEPIEREDVQLAADFAKMASDSIRDAAVNIRLYDEQLDKQQRISAYVLTHFDEAIEHHNIKVYYQPVIRTMNGLACGMEALARWIDPVIGFLSPAEFIPVLEENHLITRLDLYILEEICREMKRGEERGSTIIPVSFNLSRLDFLECDIFDEVEKIIKKYGTSRDLINAEVTESMIIDNKEILKDAIHRFREAGYQVWMDDFGSGYSSLNVIQEFDFDEVKLDMAFMKSFNEKSKDMVKAIVAMVKRLGMHTLAEGVETREQYDFLTAIGCERVQGYYISAPKPIDELFKLLDEKNIQTEKRPVRFYYDKAGLANYLTDRAFAVVEFDGKDFRYIFYNHAFRHVLLSTGRSTLNEIYYTLNSEQSALRQTFLDFQKRAQLAFTTDPEQIQSIEYVINGHYIRLSGHCVSHYVGDQEDKWLEYLEMENLTQDEKVEQHDRINRTIFSRCDIAILSIDENDKVTAEIIQTNADSTLNRQNTYYQKETKSLDFFKVSEEVIDPGDRKAYAAFINPKTLRERIASSETKCIRSLLRTKVANGSYVWKVHTLLLDDDGKTINYITRHSPIMEDGFLDRFLPEYQATKSEHQAMLLWKTLLESNTIALFWKDKDRRFVDANRRFLDIYGLNSVNDIRGKTDEDMDWNMDDRSFQNDEMVILHEGKIIRDKLGKSIIKGRLLNIMISKMPIYQDGQITGLIGTMIVLDDAKFSDIHQVNITDPLTGLLSVEGLINTVTFYIDEYKHLGKNFFVAQVNYDGFERDLKAYGERSMKKITKGLAEAITYGILEKGYRYIVGRLYAQNFVFIGTYQTKDEVYAAEEFLQIRADEIHELAGSSITLIPRVHIYFSEDTENLNSLILTATGGAIRQDRNS